MYKLFFIAKNNMKKQKGDMITFFILTFIATFLIFDCASAIFGVSKVLDSRFSEVNGAQVLMITNGYEEENECCEKAMTENSHVIDYESTPVYAFSGEYKNKKDSKKDFNQYTFLVQSFDEEPEYLNLGIDQSKLKENDILIPLYLKNSFQVGDTFQIKLGDDIYNFNVAGYAEDPYFCSSVNITIYYVYMSQTKLDFFIDEHPYLMEEHMCHKAVVDENELSADLTTMDIEHEITAEYKNLISPYSEENPDHNYLGYLAVNWQMMRGGSQFLPMIMMGIMLMFAVLILIIAIVIISFSIKNFIQRNMKNTGILEASGYTIKELRSAITVQILSVAAIGAVLGVVIGVLTFDSFADIVSSVSGLSWNQPINTVAAVATVLGILLLILVVSRVISRHYNKITVLDALRGGISTHNFKKNFFSFEKTPLPISFVLSLKETFGGLGRNIVTVLIIFVLTVSTLISFGLYENFGKDPDKLINFMGFELGDIQLQGDKEIADDLREIEGVENVLGFYGIEPVVYNGDKESSIYTYVYDDVNNALMTRVVDGRLPQHDNEIMMTGAAAEDIGAEIGDVVEIEMGDHKEEYLIVGINQRMERMGRTIIMSAEAAEKIVPYGSTQYTYTLTTKDGVSFDTMKDRIKDYAKENDIAADSLFITDAAKSLEGTVGTISNAMNLMCIIIAIITSIVVIFVESLVVRAKITREWRGMGISKALGMTSNGLISQIMLSNTPAIITGLLIGILLSKPLGGKFCLTIFSLFGMKSIDFNIPFVLMGITIIIILSVAFLTSGLLGLRVKGLKPVEMITEE